MNKLNKTIRTVVIIISVIFMTIYAVDSFLGTNYINRLLINDQEAPIININELPIKHLINRDFNYELISCTDNHDDICENVIERAFDTSILGNQTIIIHTTDQAGNKTTENYR